MSDEALYTMLVNWSDSEFAASGEFAEDLKSLIEGTLAKQADRIKALQAEVERLKDKLSVETEPSPYCPICGSCGEEGCCGSKRCMYPDTGIEALRLAVVHYDAALKGSWPYGAKGDAWEHWNEARIILQEAGETFTHPDNQTPSE